MRRLTAAALLLCAACGEEPDFDERYEQAQEKIGTKARAIDAELRKSGEMPDPRPVMPEKNNGAIATQPAES